MERQHEYTENQPQALSRNDGRLGLNHADKVCMLCREAYGANRKLVDEIGVKFSGTLLKHESGRPVPRSLSTINGSGSETANKLLAKLAQAGVRPRRSGRR